MEPTGPSSTVTPRFGEVAYAKGDVIEFPWGLPGFSHLRRFVALSPDDQPGLVWLQCVDDPQVALPAGDPHRIFPDYEPRLPGYALETLDVRNQEDFSLLCIFGFPKDGEATMNLAAPVVVNLKTRRARQVMLEDSRYQVRTPVPPRALERQGTVHPV